MRYLLFLLLALPAQAQYLEFSSIHKEDEAIHTLFHMIYEGEASRIIIAIGQRSPGDCKSENNVVVSFSFAPALIDPPAHVFLQMRDESWNAEPPHDIALVRTHSDAETTIFSTALTFDEIKEINAPGATFTVSGHEITGIVAAIDEFLRQVYAFGPCV